MNARPGPLTEAQRQALAEYFGDAVRFDAPLAPLTSARIGGPADALLTVTDADALADAAAWLWEREWPFVVLGGGSNVLVADSGVRGVVLLNRARKVTMNATSDRPWARAASGASLGSLARRTVAAGLEGLEWAVGIPGTVGGAVVGNAGAFSSEIGDVLASATLLVRGSKGKAVRLVVANEDLAFDYRSSALKRGEVQAVVLEAVFDLMRSPDPAELRAWVEEIQARRRATQPPGASMGSMFKNPPGDFAGRLIDAAGLKGLRVGDAEISTLHANFFLNRGRARARDVWSLMLQARREVYRRFGVLLEPEIEFLGAWDPTQVAMIVGPPEFLDLSGGWRA